MRDHRYIPTAGPVIIFIAIECACAYMCACVCMCVYILRNGDISRAVIMEREIAVSSPNAVSAVAAVIVEQSDISFATRAVTRFTAC